MRVAVAFASAVAFGRYANSMPLVGGEEELHEKRITDKRSLGSRGYGTCDSNSDCNPGWSCDEVFEGNDRTDSINVCLPASSNEKREVQSRDGSCTENSGCGSGWTCERLFQGAGAYVNICLPAQKRGLDRRDGTCGLDSDCSSGEICDEYYTFQSGAITTTTGCFPSAKSKRSSFFSGDPCLFDEDCDNGLECRLVQGFSPGSGRRLCLDPIDKTKSKRSIRDECDEDSDCDNGMTCQEHFSGLTWTTIHFCNWPAPEETKRNDDLERREDKRGLWDDCSDDSNCPTNEICAEMHSFSSNAVIGHYCREPWSWEEKRSENLKQNEEKRGTFDDCNNDSDCPNNEICSGFPSFSSNAIIGYYCTEPWPWEEKRSEDLELNKR